MNQSPIRDEILVALKTNKNQSPFRDEIFVALKTNKNQSPFRDEIKNARTKNLHRHLEIFTYDQKSKINQTLQSEL